MRRDYPVHNLIDEATGNERAFALVPLEEITQEPAQRSLIQRVWGMLRSKDDAEKEAPVTTDTGVSIFAGSTSALIALRYYDEMKIQQARRGMLEDYERMDAECVEAQTALDITVGNVFLPMADDEEAHEIISDDQSVKDIIDELDDRLDMHEQLPEICRGLLQAGDSFEEIVVDSHPRVARIKYLNPKYMCRNEDNYGRLEEEKAFEMKDESQTVIATFAPWQVIHTRFRHIRGNLYGRSFFFNSRRPWRQLSMMEDGVCIRYLTRAGKRLAFYIPVPSKAQPEEKKRIVRDAIRQLKRRSIVDTDGKMDLRRSPMADDEDYYIPVEEGAEGRAKVEMLDSGGMNDNLAPVTYFRDKVLLPTRVPKAYMGLEQDTRGRAMLGWQDIEFARVVRSVQKQMASFQAKLYDTELRLHGVQPERDLYKIKYPPISFIDEQMKVTVEQTRWTIAQIANTQLGIPKRWLLENILHLAEEDVEEVMSSLEPTQAQQQQGPGQFGGGAGQFGAKEMGAVKEAVYTNMRLQSELVDLKAKIKTVLTEKLNQPLTVTSKGA
jgi:hypothetical protein